MTNEKAGQEKQITPKGAVEVDEEQLDEAAGGISSYSAPTDSEALKTVKIDFTLGATREPTVSDATLTEKKI